MGLGRFLLTALAVLMTGAFFATPSAQATTQTRQRSRTITKDQKDFARALKAFDDGNFRLSRNILAGLVGSHLTNSLYWFNLGNAELKLSDMRRAAACYERVIQLRSPLSPVAGI